MLTLYEQRRNDAIRAAIEAERKNLAAMEPAARRAHLIATWGFWNPDGSLKAEWGGEGWEEHYNHRLTE